MTDETHETDRDEADPDYREAAFWEKRYIEGRYGWDIGQPAPPFVSYVHGLDGQSRGTLAVLGCGRGHDAAFFAEQGWDVTAFDISATALRMAKELVGSRRLPLGFVLRDLFTLDDDYAEAFDTVVEHTCFCAIDPQRREKYAQVIRRIVKPNGRFVGLFFAILPEGGPPFPTSADELRALFLPFFDEEALFVPPNSHESRRGQELFGVFRRRA